MKRHPVQHLESELDQIQALLDQQLLFSLTAEETRSLRAEANEILRKLAAIEGSFLTIGLLGGTGVGKSTLMNALAGSEIASTSYRRPHTEQVLIYRHEHANPLPSLPMTGVPWREMTHQADPIKQVLLCDLPDFDSLLGDHRARVLGFMEHLDVLVWITSPEKYADGRFYEFLRLVPKAKPNFYFVLNKADLIFEGGTQEMGYEQMARVAASFEKHIKENSISEPLLFLISAEQALRSDQLAPWNQFHSLSQHIFQQRDFKQVTAIKAANLDVEAQRLFSVMEKEMRMLERIESSLADSLKDLERHRPLWLQTGQEAIDLWLDKYVRPEILSVKSDPTCLVGLGYGLAIVLQRFIQASKIGVEPSSFIPPKDIVVSFQRQFEWLENRLHYGLLRQNLPTSFHERLQGVLSISKSLEGVTERLSRIAAVRIAKPLSSAFWGFRALQFLAYFLLLAFFLLAIGGEKAWQAVLDNPGGSTVLYLILAGIQTLFSAKGLAALVSYGLLNFFLAFRFYSRYKKLLSSAADKIIGLLKVALIKAWEEELDSNLDDLNALRKDINTQLSTISAAKQDKP